MTIFAKLDIRTFEIIKFAPFENPKFAKSDFTEKFQFYQGPSRFRDLYR